MIDFHACTFDVYELMNYAKLYGFGFYGGRNLTVYHNTIAQDGP